MFKEYIRILSSGQAASHTKGGGAGVFVACGRALLCGRNSLPTLSLGAPPVRPTRFVPAFPQLKYKSQIIESIFAISDMPERNAPRRFPLRRVMKAEVCKQVYCIEDFF